MLICNVFVSPADTARGRPLFNQRSGISVGNAALPAVRDNEYVYCAAFHSES